MSPPRPLTIAVECSRLTRDVRGIGRYTRALLPRLVVQRPELRLVPFARRQGELAGLRATLRELDLPDDRAGARLFAELRPGDADLWWYPWNITRPVPASGTVVATIHDVAPLAHPDPRRTRWWQNRRWRRLYRATAKRVDQIITVSTFMAEDIERYLDVPSSHVHVTPLAADDLSVPGPERDAGALGRLGICAPYVLAVNANDRRKNLDLLHRAMVHVVEQVPSAKLVMVGAHSPDTGADEPAWRRSLGFVSEDDLASLYRSARAVIVPSLYEGFGLPVLEAMRIGTPVICAHTSSLPEVAGDAALYVDPADEGELARAIVQVLTSDALHGSLRLAGLERAKGFSWDETARLTLRAFDAALGRKGAPVASEPVRFRASASRQPSRR